MVTLMRITFFLWCWRIKLPESSRIIIHLWFRFGWINAALHAVATTQRPQHQLQLVRHAAARSAGVPSQALNRLTIGHVILKYSRWLDVAISLVGGGGDLAT